MARPASKKQGAKTKNPKRDKQKRPNKSSVLTIADQREVAKAGMIGSIGALFVTGLFRFQGARLLHFWAGWALLGFSIWHHIVSRPSVKTASEQS